MRRRVAKQREEHQRRSLPASRRGADGQARISPPLGLCSAVLLLSALLTPAVWACNRVHFDAEPQNNIACRCNATSCTDSAEHFLEFDWPRDDAQLVRVVSSRAGQRFKVDTLQASDLRPLDLTQPADRIVELNINERLQKIAGYGGAFTDSASMLLQARLAEPLRNHALESYFGARGLDYNLARVPIGGTDMSWRAYSCDDLPAGSAAAHDFELSQFRLQPEDRDFKLPLIRQINALRRREAKRGPLKLLASSWSAPNWMKTDNSLVQGRLKGASDGPYYDAYARYLIRFLDEYERELRNASVYPDQAHMWALTPQNEPCTPGRLGYSVVNYNSVNFEPQQMADFLRLHLVPSLIKSGRRPEELALFVWDDTLLGFERYKEALLNDTQVYSFVRGLALHWYSQGLDKLPYKSLYETRRWLPDKFSLLSTEASFISRPRLGDWSRGVRYARDIIENLRAGAIGWIDWNLALNSEGGPTWSRNFLDAALVVDERTGELYKQPMYFAIGHVSRFLRTDAHIVSSAVYEQQPAKGDGPAAKKLQWKMIDEDDEQTSDILVAAAENAHEKQQPSDALRRQIGLVLLNRAPGKLRAQLSLVNCKSRLAAAGPLVVELEAESITSLAFNC